MTTATTGCYRHSESEVEVESCFLSILLDFVFTCKALVMKYKTY